MFCWGEAKSDTGELHAAEIADPRNKSAFTVLLAMDNKAQWDWTITNPRSNGFWRGTFKPENENAMAGKITGTPIFQPRNSCLRTFRFWSWENQYEGSVEPLIYRRILAKDNLKTVFLTGDITLVNHPQNDYFFRENVGMLVDEMN